MEYIQILVEELRKRGLSNGASTGYHSGLMDEAADTIERLQAELKTAKTEARKEFAESFVQKAEKTKIIYIADTTIQEQETGWYQISVADFDNLLKATSKEREG